MYSLIAPIFPSEQEEQYNYPILADNYSRYPELLSITSKQLYDFNANGQTHYLFDVGIIAILF